MVSTISVGNSPAHVAFSPALTYSCISLSFWKANQRAYALNSTTVDYSVTTSSIDYAFTTAMAFYVCGDLTFDAVLGRDYMERCFKASGAFFFVNLSFTVFSPVTTRSYQPF